MALSINLVDVAYLGRGKAWCNSVVPLNHPDDLPQTVSFKTVSVTELSTSKFVLELFLLLYRKRSYPWPGLPVNQSRLEA